MDYLDAKDGQDEEEKKETKEIFERETEKSALTRAAVNKSSKKLKLVKEEMKNENQQLTSKISF